MLKASQARFLALGAGGLLAASAAQWFMGRDRFSFHDRVALITGGSRGLGLLMARELAKEGARLGLVARSADELANAERELTAAGAEVLSLCLDLRDRSNARLAVQRTVDRFGSLDVLINNAGVIQVGPLDHMEEADFEEAMAVHFWAPLCAMLEALPVMRRQRQGRIVNIASIGGVAAVPHLLPYSASKFALVGLSRGMRSELRKDGIKVTTVCPGLMRTGSHVNALFKGNHTKEYTWFSVGNALPFASMDAREAARRVLNASRAGEPFLVLTVPANILALSSGVMPGLTDEMMALVDLFLPGGVGVQGNQSWSGWKIRHRLDLGKLTQRSDREINPNNEDLAASHSTPAGPEVLLPADNFAPR